LNKIFLSFILSLIALRSIGQPILKLDDRPSINIDHYEILPDRGYTFRQIISSPKLPFVVNDSIRIDKSAVYWIRLSIENPSSYSRYYQLQIDPNMDHTLYNFNEDSGKWIAYRTGLMIKSRYDRRLQKMLPCILQAKIVNTLYIKTNLSTLATFRVPFKPRIILLQSDYVRDREQNLWTVWIITITILFLFILNNLYIYFSFRDKTVLYYLLAQLGGMIYITSYRHFFSLIFHCPIFTFSVTDKGFATCYGLNFLLMHIGILLTMYGLVQFTRSFFDATKTLPKLDHILKSSLTAYLIITVLIIFANVFVFYLEQYTMMFENILALVLVVLILYTCITGYLRNLRAAGSFLLANLLPLGLVMGTALFHVMFQPANLDTAFLPDMSIITQSLGFSIALVARTRLIQNDLKIKEIETRQLEFDLRELTLTKKLIEVENQKINVEILQEKTMNEILLLRLETNQRELASTTLYIVQKNKMLSGLKEQIDQLHERYPENRHEGLKNIASILKNDLYLEADWDKFKLHFDQVHPRFFEDLYAKHPSLTKNEIRIYAYFHMKLSTKEIASLLNIDPASVRRAKTRLYKKMALYEED